jgi:mono/diheme cytochrome c family protein
MTKLAAILLLGLLISCESNSFPKGQEVYAKQCQNCHMKDGSGLGTYIPSLNNKSMNFTVQVCTIYKGKGNKNLAMPAFADLNPTEYTNLINFLNEKFGSKKIVLPKDIESALTTCK